MIFRVYHKIHQNRDGGTKFYLEVQSLHKVIKIVQNRNRNQSFPVARGGEGMKKRGDMMPKDKKARKNSSTNDASRVTDKMPTADNTRNANSNASNNAR